MEVSAAERKQDRLRGEVSIAVSGVAESAEFSWMQQRVLGPRTRHGEQQDANHHSGSA